MTHLRGNWGKTACGREGWNNHPWSSWDAGDSIPNTIPYTMKTGIIFPRSLFDETCADAQQQARRTGKTQYVRGMNWDGLYGSLGFTNDPEMEIGRLHAIVTADKIMLLDSIHNNSKNTTG